MNVPLDIYGSADGYVVVPLLGADTVAMLRARFESLGVDPEVERFVSTVHCDLETGRAVDAELKAVLAAPVRDLIGDYEPFLAAFFAKGARRGEQMHFHQDLTYTDERTHRAVLAWIPLVDVDASNGTMQVVPGSHRWTTGIRPGRDDEAPATDPHLDAFASLAVTLDIPAGHALVYDPAIIHGTPPNRTDQTRPIAGVALAPAGADLVHFRRADHGGIEGANLGPHGQMIQAFLGAFDELPPLEPWTAMVRPEDFDAPLAAAFSRRSEASADPAPAKRRWYRPAVIRPRTPRR